MWGVHTISSLKIGGGKKRRERSNKKNNYGGGELNHRRGVALGPVQ